MSTFSDYADMYCEPWRDPDPEAEQSNRKFSRLVRERGLSKRWNDAVTQEDKNAVLAELKILEQECGLAEPPPAQPPPSLAERIKIR